MLPALIRDVLQRQIASLLRSEPGLQELAPQLGGNTGIKKDIQDMAASVRTSHQHITVRVCWLTPPAAMKHMQAFPIKCAQQECQPCLDRVLCKGLNVAGLELRWIAQCVGLHIAVVALVLLED